MEDRYPLEPWRWRSLARAGKFVRQRAEKGKVLVWGHDDLDGVTSTAIMLKALDGTPGKTGYYIPPRTSVHYGVDPEVLRAVTGRAKTLLLTVDCGISNSAEVKTARNMGFPVVVTDHHELPPILPPADMVVNPKIPEKPRPTTELAGCGVALYLAAALEGEEIQDWLTHDPETLAWAALGTVSDRVPLSAENRAIVKTGLPVLAENRVLRQVCRIAGFDLSLGLSPGLLRRTLVPFLSLVESAGFRHETVELLRGDIRPERISEIRQLMSRRQQELEENFTRLRDGSDALLPYILIVDRSLKPDMIGSLASMLRDRTGKPAVVVSEKNGMLTGESRGYQPLDWVELLDSISRVFLQHGGHKQAAGFTVSPGFEAEFPGLLSQALEERRQLIVPAPEKEADYEFNHLSEAVESKEELAQRAPFGPGNPMPTVLFNKISLPPEADSNSCWPLSHLMSLPVRERANGSLRAYLDITHTGELLICLSKQL
jgi:single-stranded-DNA-specific exonuclease